MPPTSTYIMRATFLLALFVFLYGLISTQHTSLTTENEQNNDTNANVPYNSSPSQVFGYLWDSLPLGP